ncbi:glycosyl hydrolase 2 galactose-binding domain-containing protein [Eisenbergiella porci]|uniref:glycosyl hydrolase 2 galactose-binding domain-containing protein n=1 Tax=Eisenbergiella TaxID=1432051 RepID=UPI0038B7C737
MIFDQPERLFIRRMTCIFYWDWGNRFVTAGSWRPVISVVRSIPTAEGRYWISSKHTSE